MGFNRNNYIRIKEEYNGKYRRAEEEAKLRRHEVELSVPGVAELNKQLSLTGIEIMEAAMNAFFVGIKMIADTYPQHVQMHRPSI